jgi:predicted nucleotidyltransferase
MSLPKDWKEFLQLLNSRGAEYVVVGAFALAFHSEPRFTGDLDLLIHRTPENANRIIEALHEFGFASLGITRGDLLSEGTVIQLGIQPNRIDLLNFLTGVDTEVVWRNRISGDLDGVPLAYIDLESFKVNKLAAGRDKDLEDLRRLREKS